EEQIGNQSPRIEDFNGAELSFEHGLAGLIAVDKALPFGRLELAVGVSVGHEDVALFILFDGDHFIRPAWYRAVAAHVDEAAAATHVNVLILLALPLRHD